MDFDEVAVKESPGLCRCCLSEGCYKDLSSEYSWMGETEIYADMLLECFDISVSQHVEGPNGPMRLICEVCITRLRDACNFKKQVQESEKKFVDMVGRGEFRHKASLVYESSASMKEEHSTLQVEYLDELDFGDDADDILKTDVETEQAEDITAIALPVKRGRGRPRKNPDVKSEKKKAKLEREEKPRTSKIRDKDSILLSLLKVPLQVTAAKVRELEAEGPTNNTLLNSDATKVKELQADGPIIDLLDDEDFVVPSKMEPETTEEEMHEEYLEENIIDTLEVESEEKIHEEYLEETIVENLEEESEEKIDGEYLEEESEEKIDEEYLEEENKEKKTKAPANRWWEKIKKKQRDGDADSEKEDKKDKDFEPAESSDQYSSDNDDDVLGMLRQRDKLKADKERARELSIIDPLPADITTLFKRIDDAQRGRDPTKRTYYECIRCLAFYKTESAVSAHIRRRICNAKQRGSEDCITTDDMRLDDDNTYVCLHCYRRHTYMSDMKKHIKKRHFLTFLPKCSECSETFPSQSSLLNHKLEAHGIDERFHCTACSSILTTSWSFTKHMESVHMLNRVKCPKCDYEGFGMQNLKRHSEVHETEVFTCRFCVKTFTRMRCLDQHERIHTRHKMKQCKYCEASFVQLSSLRSHMRRRHPNDL